MWDLDYKESLAQNSWCYWNVVLEKTFESPLDRKEIKWVRPKGNQSSIFIGRTDAEAETPIRWPPDVKNWLTGKDPDAWKDWRHEEKGTTEDEMVWWDHQLNGPEFRQGWEVEWQGSLESCSLGVTKSWTRLSNQNELKIKVWLFFITSVQNFKAVFFFYLFYLFISILSWSAIHNYFIFA